MKVMPLGISSGVPTVTRNVSGVAVDLERAWLLLDCGEGIQSRLLLSKLRRSKLEAVLITHLHGDHVFGLPGLLSTLSLQGHERVLDLYGPSGLRELVESTLRLTATHLGYELRIHELGESGLLGAREWIRETPDYRIKALPLRHRLLTMGYRIEERPRRGRFRPEKAKELGVPPGPSFRELHLGASVRLADGRVIHSAQVTDPMRPGLSMAYCTDTEPCPSGVELARGVDLLIHEATYSEDMQEAAAERGHSTAAGAARVAEQAGAQELLITHFSPRYLDPGPLLSEARRVFPRTRAARELEAIQVGETATSVSACSEPGVAQSRRDRPELAILIGIPGSGKTTFYQDRFSRTHEQVSKDRLRSVRDREARQAEQIRAALEAGRSVALDNTHVDRASRSRAIALGRELGAKVIAYLFEPDLKASLHRNQARIGHARIPDVAVHSMHMRYEPPMAEEGFEEIRLVQSRPEGGYSIRKKETQS